MTETLSLWTIYEHPADYPNHFVARRFDLGRPTGDFIYSKDIESLRSLLRARGRVRFARDPTDEPQIVETWI